MTETPPAGWYPDPTAPGTQRYWDGTNWTEHRAPASPTGAPVVQSRTNGMAIASMVLGILWIYWIGSILALIFGYISLGQIKRAEGRETGRGMAIAGIVLGWIGIGFLVLVLILLATGSIDVEDYDYS